MACRSKLRRVGANDGVSGQITSCWATITSRRGKLRRVEANYGMSGTNYGMSGTNYVVSGTNYVVSRQIASCRGKLRRVGANYDVSGQFTSCRGKLRRHPCPQTSHNSSSTVYS